MEGCMDWQVSEHLKKIKENPSAVLTFIVLTVRQRLR